MVIQLHFEPDNFSCSHRILNLNICSATYPPHDAGILQCDITVVH